MTLHNNLFLLIIIFGALTLHGAPRIYLNINRDVALPVRTTSVVDWNNDGMLDILLNDLEGNSQLYLNSIEQFEFALPIPAPTNYSLDTRSVGATIGFLKVANLDSTKEPENYDFFGISNNKLQVNRNGKVTISGILPKGNLKFSAYAENSEGEVISKEFILTSPEEPSAVLFLPKGHLPSSPNLTKSLSLVDMDGDGDLDFLNKGDSGEFLLQSNFVDSFSHPILVYPNEKIQLDEKNLGYIGSFLAFDPNDSHSDDEYVFSLVAGEGSEFNPFFEISTSGELKHVRNSELGVYSIRVRVTDVSGLFLEKIFEFSKILDKELDDDSFVNKPISKTLQVSQETNAIKFEGLLLADGGSNNVEVGFLWGAKLSLDLNDPDTEKIGAFFESNTNKFFSQIDLNSSGRFYFKSYASNEKGITFGSVRRFKGMSVRQNTIVESGPWQGGNDFGDGWVEVPWFGSILLFPNNWVYHIELGWLYSMAGEGGGVWLWHHAHGWLWTVEGVYPFIYKNTVSNWLYHIQLPTGGNILYDYNSKNFLVP